MGIRFRKSVNVGPLRINLSKSGIGYSVGTKHYRVTKTANGRIRKTANLGGGINYVKEESIKKKSDESINNGANNKMPDDPNKKNSKRLIKVLLTIFFPLGLLYFVWKNDERKKGMKILLSALLLFYVSFHATLCYRLANPEAFNEEKIAEKKESDKNDNVSDNKSDNENQNPEEEQAPTEEQSTPDTNDAPTQTPESNTPSEQEQPTQTPVVNTPPVVEEQPTQSPAQPQEPVTSMVWVAGPDYVGKYHSRASCSNMTSPIQLTRDEAIARGYTPCKKCY